MAIPLVILHYITKLPRERYAIFFLVFLGLGTVATAATCCALHILYRHELVVSYGYVQLAELLAIVELSVGLSAVSLPSLKAVLYRREEHRRSKSSASTRERRSDAGSKASTATRETVTSDGGWEDEDERRLVIMRRLSYEVASVELPLRKDGLTDGATV